MENCDRWNVQLQRSVAVFACKHRRAPGRGKSGGYRVVTYYGGGDLPVFLLNVFKKGDRVNLNKAEINELREELSHLAREYREGAMRHDKGR